MRELYKCLDCGKIHAQEEGSNFDCQIASPAKKRTWKDVDQMMLTTSKNGWDIRLGYSDGNYIDFSIDYGMDIDMFDELFRFIKKQFKGNG